jgi:hypothetical protein
MSALTPLGLVMRLLRSEALDQVSRERGVEVERLERWKARGLTAMDEDGLPPARVHRRRTHRPVVRHRLQAPRPVRRAPWRQVRHRGQDLALDRQREGLDGRWAPPLDGDLARIAVGRGWLLRFEQRKTIAPLPERQRRERLATAGGR